MKRLLLLVALVLAVASTRAVSRAQSQEPTTPTLVPAPTVTPTPTPAIDPTHFALSTYSFPGPAGIDVDRVESNAQASAEADIVHFGAPFDVEGRLTGYYKVAVTPNINNHGSTHPLITYYLVSTFATPAAAAAAFAQQKKGWDDAITLPPAGTTVTKQPATGPAIGDQSSGGVYLLTFKSTTGDVVDREESFVQSGIYLIEVFQENLHGDAKYATAERSAIGSIETTLNGVATGAIAGPPAPVYPSSVNLLLLSTRFESNNLSLNFTKNLKLAPVKSVRAGSRVQASTYFVVKAARARAKFTVEFRLTRAGIGSTLDRTYTHAMGAYAPDYYRDDLHDLQLNAPGNYTLTIRVTVGTVTKSGTTHLTVTGRAARFRTMAQRLTLGAEHAASLGVPLVGLRAERVESMAGSIR